MSWNLPHAVVKTSHDGDIVFKHCGGSTEALWEDAVGSYTLTFTTLTCSLHPLSTLRLWQNDLKRIASPAPVGLFVTSVFDIPCFTSLAASDEIYWWLRGLGFQRQAARLAETSKRSCTIFFIKFFVGFYLNTKERCPKQTCVWSDKTMHGLFCATSRACWITIIG